MSTRNIRAGVLGGVLALWACDGAGGPRPPAAEAQRVEALGPIFRMSVARPVDETNSKRNWCLAAFSEVEPFGSDTSAAHSRFFYLRPGVTWLAIGDDLGRANLFLRPHAAGGAEVFTGAHFPRCLSRPEYVQLSAANLRRITYDNRQYLQFALEVSEENRVSKITVIFPQDRFYAVEAVRCPSCE